MKCTDETNQIDRIAVGLERLSTLFRAAVWEEAKLHGLSPLQSQILIFLRDHGSELATVTLLAVEFAVTKATVSDAVRTLVDKGVLERRSGADARAQTLVLTPAGRHTVDRLDALGQFFAEHLRHVDADVRGRMLDGLLLLLTAFHRSGLIPVRMCPTCRNLSPEPGPYGARFCSVLNAPLRPADLRIDCPEHLLLATEAAG